MPENDHGDVTKLVCLDALREAIGDVEKAQIRYREASRKLASIRGALDRAVEEAHRQQSFAPLGSLFDDEETALAVYERAKDQLTSAEKRWRDVGAALAYEKAQMRAGPLPRKRLN